MRETRVKKITHPYAYERGTTPRRGGELSSESSCDRSFLEWLVLFINVLWSSRAPWSRELPENDMRFESRSDRSKGENARCCFERCWPYERRLARCRRWLWYQIEKRWRKMDKFGLDTMRNAGKLNWHPMALRTFGVSNHAHAHCPHKSPLSVHNTNRRERRVSPLSIRTRKKKQKQLTSVFCPVTFLKEAMFNAIKYIPFSLPNILQTLMKDIQVHSSAILSAAYNDINYASRAKLCWTGPIPLQVML